MAEHPTRKLAVILHADVVGSTALVQRDEALAHERIQDVFHRFSGTIESYNGNPLELRGDALVAEFNRASDAVEASLAFQAENTRFNSTLEDDIRPTLRIGISLGEVVVADNTITGEGIVLAQRLEQLASAGGVCIQGAVYEAVPGRLPFEYESLGEQELKGFSEPVRAYAISLKSGESIPPPEVYAMPGEAQPKRPKQRWIVVEAMALLVIVGGGLAWFQPWVPREEPASVESMAFPLPDKPSIAVLPFNNMSDDPQQEYFVDGMTEDLITDLSKISGLFVIARNSSFTYKGKAVNIRQVARELGVRYVLEGSVRRVGDRVRVNAQLIDAATATHLWAERYDYKLDDIFALQDKITQKIIGQLAVHLGPEDKTLSEQRETRDTVAHDAFLQGWAHYLRATPAHYVSAIPLFEEAIRRDPGYGRAYAALGSVYQNARVKGWQNDLGLTPDDTLEKVLRYIEKIKQHPTPLGHQVVSSFLTLAGKHEQAIAEARSAIALNSNNPAGYFATAQALTYARRPSEAGEMIAKAMRLDPHYPPDYLFQLGMVQFSLERFEQAAESLEAARERVPAHRGTLTFLVATYGLLGRTEEARTTLDQLKRLASNAFMDWRLSITVLEANALPFKDTADLERLQTGLRKGGMPEFKDEWGLAREHKLSGAEIRKLAFGHTLKGRHPVSGLEFTVKRTADGQFTSTGLWSDTGVSRIVDDRLCNEWSKYRPSCAVVYRNPDGTRDEHNQYLLVQRSGAFPFSAVD
ncbi:MAG: adenylate/guanylate cyclase domain-containing protein [Gammaproteobacteria bacterium]|nr:MAG: adenylate/guanylate cyclase domain-containing protein [Gammaproteobacteria bacterium]